MPRKGVVALVQLSEKAAGSKKIIIIIILQPVKLQSQATIQTQSVFLALKALHAVDLKWPMIFSICTIKSRHRNKERFFFLAPLLICQGASFSTCFINDVAQEGANQ